MLTEAVAVGRVVVVPITTPASMVTEGAAAVAAPRRAHTAGRAQVNDRMVRMSKC